MLLNTIFFHYKRIKNSSFSSFHWNLNRQYIKLNSRGLCSLYYLRCLFTESIHMLLLKRWPVATHKWTQINLLIKVLFHECLNFPAFHNAINYVSVIKFIFSKTQQTIPWKYVKLHFDKRKLRFFPLSRVYMNNNI